jgi:hypothetical protein
VGLLEAWAMFTLMSALTWRRCCAAAALACLPWTVPCIAAAQLTVLQTGTSLQYGNANTVQTTLRDPWLLSVNVPPYWQGLADLSLGVMEVGVINDTVGVSNTYASLLIDIFNPSAAAVTLGPLALRFDGVFTRTDDGGDGLHGNLLIAIASVFTPGSPLHSARLDHQYVANCVSNRQVCRDNLTTTPVLSGLGSVSVNTATNGLIDAVLHLPGLTLAPNTNAQYLFSFQASAYADGGWAAAVDATHSAQLALQLPPGVSINSAQPLAWATPVPEPAGALLWALGGLPLWLALRQRERA